MSRASTPGLKRTREESRPRVTYHVQATSRTFDRLFQEDSLSDIRDVVRKKLGLREDQKISLAQLRGDKVIDLEDDDDFDAFDAVAHETMSVDVLVTIAGQESQPIPAQPEAIDNSITSSKKPVNGNSSKDAGPSTIPEPAADDNPRPKKKRKDAVSVVDSTPSKEPDTTKSNGNGSKKDHAHASTPVQPPTTPKPKSRRRQLLVEPETEPEPVAEGSTKKRKNKKKNHVSEPPSDPTEVPPGLARQASASNGISTKKTVPENGAKPVKGILVKRKDTAVVEPPVVVPDDEGEQPDEAAGQHTTAETPVTEEHPDPPAPKPKRKKVKKKPDGSRELKPPSATQLAFGDALQQILADKSSGSIQSSIVPETVVNSAVASTSGADAAVKKTRTKANGKVVVPQTLLAGKGKGRGKGKDAEKSSGDANVSAVPPSSTAPTAPESDSSTGVAGSHDKHLKKPKPAHRVSEDEAGPSFPRVEKSLEPLSDPELDVLVRGPQKRKSRSSWAAILDRMDTDDEDLAQTEELEEDEDRKSRGRKKLKRTSTALRRGSMVRMMAESSSDESSSDTHDNARISFVAPPSVRQERGWSSASKSVPPEDVEMKDENEQEQDEELEQEGKNIDSPVLEEEKRSPEQDDVPGNEQSTPNEDENLAPTSPANIPVKLRPAISVPSTTSPVLRDPSPLRESNTKTSDDSIEADNEERQKSPIEVDAEPQLPTTQPDTPRSPRVARSMRDRSGQLRTSTPRLETSLLGLPLFQSTPANRQLPTRGRQTRSATRTLKPLTELAASAPSLPIVPAAPLSTRRQTRSSSRKLPPHDSASPPTLAELSQSESFRVVRPSLSQQQSSTEPASSTEPTTPPDLPLPPNTQWTVLTADDSSLPPGEGDSMLVDQLGSSPPEEESIRQTPLFLHSETQADVFPYSQSVTQMQEQAKEVEQDDESSGNEDEDGAEVAASINSSSQRNLAFRGLSSIFGKPLNFFSQSQRPTPTQKPGPMRSLYSARKESESESESDSDDDDSEAEKKRVASHVPLERQAGRK